MMKILYFAALYFISFLKKRAKHKGAMCSILTLKHHKYVLMWVQSAANKLQLTLPAKSVTLLSNMEVELLRIER